MKLRIKGNSLRLRITPSEMARLLETGRVEESIRFGPGPDERLTYAVEFTPTAAALTVRYAPGEVSILVSSAAARQWADGPEVGLYGQAAIDRDTLELAVEKDFACLDKNDPENVDTFPNPKQGAVC
jgi:hypothetical protein